MFDRHIPAGLAASSEVLLYKIGNIAVIKGIVDKNPAAHYIVYDRECVCKLARIACTDTEITGVLSDVESQGKYDILDDKNMKFDLIIMNPPYARNLHLKILAEAIKHLKDEKSLCVNLSPVRWLQDPLAKSKKNSDFNRYKKSISNYIQHLDVIDKLNVQACFPNTVMTIDLGVYVCSVSGGFDYMSLIDLWIIKALQKQSSHVIFDFNQNAGIRVRFPTIISNAGSGIGRKPQLNHFGKLIWFKDGKRNGKWWYDWYMHNQHTKMTETISCSVKFSTEEEAENFCKSFSTTFGKAYTHLMRRDVHVTPEVVLWLGDAINPRTGLKGYLSEWTNEDLYKYFNISAEEQKIIEETVVKYR